MQLVVEISEDTFFDLKKKQNRTEVDNAVLNGTPLDKIRAEIIEHENRCHLSDDEYPACKDCTNNVFGVIYGILDKYKAGGN